MTVKSYRSSLESSADANLLILSNFQQDNSRRCNSQWLSLLFWLGSPASVSLRAHKDCRTRLVPQCTVILHGASLVR